MCSDILTFLNLTLFFMDTALTPTEGQPVDYYSTPDALKFFRTYFSDGTFLTRAQLDTFITDRVGGNRVLRDVLDCVLEDVQSYKGPSGRDLFDLDDVCRAIKTSRTIAHLSEELRQAASGYLVLISQ